MKLSLPLSLAFDNRIFTTSSHNSNSLNYSLNSSLKVWPFLETPGASFIKLVYVQKEGWNMRAPLPQTKIWIHKSPTWVETVRRPTPALTQAYTDSADMAQRRPTWTWHDELKQIKLKIWRVINIVSFQFIFSGNISTFAFTLCHGPVDK